MRSRVLNINQIGVIGWSPQDIDGRATDAALGWSVSLGSTSTYGTTLQQDYKVQLFDGQGMRRNSMCKTDESLFTKDWTSGDLTNSAGIAGDHPKPISTRERNAFCVPSTGKMDQKGPVEELDQYL